MGTRLTGGLLGQFRTMRTSSALLAALVAAYGLALAAAASWGRSARPPLPIDLYLALLGTAFAAYVLILPFILRGGLPGWVLRGLMVTAVAARVVTLLGPHRENSDVWRYLWDGHVLAHGFNPHAHVPEDPALDTIRDPTIYDHLNPAYSAIHTVYGPVAGLAFAACGSASPDGPDVVRIVMASGDLATVVLLVILLRRVEHPEEWALVYGLNPLVVDSFAQRGQMEGLLLPLLMLVPLLLHGRRPALAGGVLAAALLVKVVAVVLVPLILFGCCAATGIRRGRFLLGFTAVGILGAAPLVASGPGAVGGLLRYAAEWRTNAALFPLAEAVGGTSVARLASLIGLACVLVAGLRARGTLADLPRRAALVFCAVLLLAPAVFPWYVTWTLPLTPFLLASPPWRWLGRALVCWSGTVLLWYLRFLAYPPLDAPCWPGLAAVLRRLCAHVVEPWRLPEYLPVLMLAGLGLWTQRRFRWRNDRAGAE